MREAAGNRRKEADRGQSHGRYLAQPPSLSRVLVQVRKDDYRIGTEATESKHSPLTLSREAIPCPSNRELDTSNSSN